MCVCVCVCVFDCPHVHHHVLVCTCTHMSIHVYIYMQKHECKHAYSHSCVFCACACVSCSPDRIVCTFSSSFSCISSRTDSGLRPTTNEGDRRENHRPLHAASMLPCFGIRAAARSQLWPRLRAGERDCPRVAPPPPSPPPGALFPPLNPPPPDLPASCTRTAAPVRAAASNPLRSAGASSTNPTHFDDSHAVRTRPRGRRWFWVRSTVASSAAAPSGAEIAPHPRPQSNSHAPGDPGSAGSKGAPVQARPARSIHCASSAEESSSSTSDDVFRFAFVSSARPQADITARALGTQRLPRPRVCRESATSLLLASKGR